MSKRRQDSEIVWLAPHAGFGPGNTYAVIVPEPGYFFNPEWLENEEPPEQWDRSNPTMTVTDWTPCMLDCDDRDCREWADLWHLPGATRSEAIANLIARNFSGHSYHVSECEMSDERTTARR